MIVTLLGMTILDKDEQFENAQLPILVTLSGIIILNKDVQSQKALSPILVTLLGITILDKDVQLKCIYQIIYSKLLFYSQN